MARSTLALLVAACGRAEPRLDVHARCRELERARDGSAPRRRARSSTTILGLSKSHWRVVPPKYVDARTSERGASARVEVEDELGPHRARAGEHHDEEPERARCRPATRSCPTWAQSTCACSPRSGSRRRYTSRFGAGRTVHHEAAKRAHAAAVAALPEHVVAAASTRAAGSSSSVSWMKPVYGAHQERAARCALGSRASSPRTRAHDVLVHAELGGDRAHLPVLGVEAGARSPPRPRRRRSSALSRERGSAAAGHGSHRRRAMRLPRRRAGRRHHLHVVVDAALRISDLVGEPQ